MRTLVSSCVLLFAVLLCSGQAHAANLVCENDKVSVLCDAAPLLATAPNVFRCTVENKTVVPPVIPPTDPVACAGTAISPSMSQSVIQSKLTANTTTCWAPGAYNATALYVLPVGHKAYCTSRRACVINGNMTLVIGFRVDHGSTNVRIQAFNVKNSKTNTGWPQGCIQARDGGVIDDNEVSNCHVGITIDENSTIANNFIHHNRHSGMSGGPGIGGLVASNEISFNNTNHDDPNWDAGGVKVVGSTAGRRGLVFRANYVHDNYGQGLWCDGNVGADYIGNRIENNLGPGIFHEISWDANIKDNTLKNNSTGTAANQSCFHGGEIAVNNSQRVVISGNIVTPAAGKNGICLNHSTRTQAAWFPQALANVTVSGNQVFAHGLSKSGSSGNHSAGIVFNGNTYVLDNLTAQNFVMDSTFMTPTQWRAAGFDANGVFRTW